MALYADVIVDISHEKLDRTFQYRIPAQMEEQIVPGVPVEIPFGRGNRLIRGYVTGVTDRAKCETLRIRDIAGIVTDGVPIEAQLIALAAWMKEHFGGTMNQALKTVIPVKRKTAGGERRLVSLTAERKEAESALAQMEKKHQTARARLLESLLVQSPLPYEVITGKLNVTAPVIRALEERQLVRVEKIRNYRNPLDRMQKQGCAVRLNSCQRQIAADILARQKAGDTRPSLIYGVTGSGKTEVYMELISQTVAKGKQAIVLIPEIALTFQTVVRFYSRFGERVSILNSRMSAGERYDQFERARTGAIDVIIGPRSALFTPFPDLGFIIIDEEHEASYKSESVPRYHARETAAARARLCGACLVLGSATPSVESYARARSGSYQLYEMNRRVSDRKLPNVYIADLREELKEGNRSILSGRLRELMTDRLDKGEQIMLFLNRRGMAGFVNCRMCGHVIKCPHCDVSLTLHNDGKLYCHYCGHTQPMVRTCPECGSSYIGGFRAGTQKIEQYIAQQFPTARVLRMDLDTTRKKDGYEKILSAFANQEADILVGTQMIVKGHDFPNVTLVGVLAADLSLHAGDYRAAERTFQLLTQAAGRAGRGQRPGEVVIQTYQPKHYSIVAAAAQDYRAFYEQEIFFRRMMHYPPAWHMLVIHLDGECQERTAGAADALKEKLLSMADEREGEIQVIGPADAALAKINDIYRKILYVKGMEENRLIAVKDALEELAQQETVCRGVAVQFDFDPMNGF